MIYWSTNVRIKKTSSRKQKVLLVVKGPTGQEKMQTNEKGAIEGHKNATGLKGSAHPQ